MNSFEISPKTDLSRSSDNDCISYRDLQDFFAEYWQLAVFHI